MRNERTITYPFLNLRIDLNALEKLVSTKIGRVCQLQPLSLKCTYPVFRVDSEFFVKVGPIDEWRRTYALLDMLNDCDLFLPLCVREQTTFGDYALFIYPWCEVTSIRPETMTDAQVRGFLNGCVRLSTALQRITDYERLCDSNYAPEAMYARLLSYARRHPFVSRCFHALLEVNAKQRTYCTRKTVVVHNDFHFRNYGFKGDTLAHVFDFDKLAEGLPCHDCLSAFIARYACIGLSTDERHALHERTRLLFSYAPWSRDEMTIAINVLRLKYAVRRVDKHPNSLFTAMDIARRDRYIREILNVLNATPFVKL